MPPEPATKHTVAFVDGQNLFYAAREAFGYSYPSYDPLKLAQRICLDHRWQLVVTRFYTGVPDATVRLSWYQFCNAKLNAMARRGINGTDRIPIDRATYDACLDPNDYRPRKPKAAK